MKYIILLFSLFSLPTNAQILKSIPEINLHLNKKIKEYDFNKLNIVFNSGLRSNRLDVVKFNRIDYITLMKYDLSVDYMFDKNVILVFRFLLDGNPNDLNSNNLYIFGLIKKF